MRGAHTPAWSPATTTVNGIRLHHRVAGDGPPVVLLHGWPQTGWCWRRVVDALARDHTEEAAEELTAELRSFLAAA